MRKAAHVAEPVPILTLGILGTARIARSFAAAVSASQHVVIGAVASRDASKAREFAREFSIARGVGSYEELIADAAIDAVYIPLPNSLHAEWSIRALGAGKHVLCEKPLATTAAQARAMFAAAQAHGVHLVEGYPYRLQPQTLRMRELLRQNTIGEIRMIQASFAFTLGDAANIRLQRELGGGALMDIGSYPVSLARMVAGSRPIRVQALAQWDEKSGVDRAMAATLQFANGLWAQIACSFSACLHREALIVGANGLIQTTYLNHTANAAEASLRLRIGTDRTAEDSVLQNAPANGFLAQADAFAGLVQHGAAWEGTTPEESVDIMLTIEALQQSARSGHAVDIAPG